MVDSVNTNPGALVGLQVLTGTGIRKEENEKEISTGQRINGPEEDAATFAIAQLLRGDVAGAQAVREGIDFAESATNVAITAGEQIGGLAIEARALALRASDQTLDQASRDALQAEFSGLTAQIDTAAQQANFGNTNLVNGGDDLEVLADQNGQTINVAAQDLSSAALGLDSLSLGSSTDALAAVSVLETAGTEISGALADLGASAQRLSSQGDFSTQLTDQLRVELGNLVDSNLGEAAAQQTALEIQQRLGVSALNIANASPRTLLGFIDR